MTRRSVRRVDRPGSGIPPGDPIAHPATCGTVELGGIAADPRTAVEMPGPWKSQNDFHRPLEISLKNARFPHSHSGSSSGKNNKSQKREYTHGRVPRRKGAD